MNKTLNLLGLAKRAGKLITGEELVIKAVQNGSARLVFLANDASANLTKKMTDKTTTYNIKLNTRFTENELSAAIGQDRKVIALTDDGFTKAIQEKNS